MKHWLVLKSHGLPFIKLMALNAPSTFSNIKREKAVHQPLQNEQKWLICFVVTKEIRSDICITTNSTSVKKKVLKSLTFKII